MLKNNTFGSILDIKSPVALGLLRPSQFFGREITQEEFTHILKLHDAFWQYPGDPNPDVPHALTKAGKCTNGFIDTLRILRESNLCEILGGQLLMKVRQIFKEPIRWVISAAYAGIDLGHEVGRQARARHAFVEKDAKGNPTVWARHTIEQDETVLIVNELMTTANGSTFETKRAVVEKNKVQPVKFAPLVADLVNRSKDAEALADGTPVVCFARYKMDTYIPGPDTCPLCAAGSKPFKPKIEGNWETYFKPYIV